MAFFLNYLFMAKLSLPACTGAFSSCGAWVSHCTGFSCCRARVPEHPGSSGHGPQAQQLRFTGSRAWPRCWWHTGWAALWHVKYPQARDWTHVPSTGRRILNHCTTREVLPRLSFFFLFSNYLLNTNCVLSIETVVWKLLSTWFVGPYIQWGRKEKCQERECTISFFFPTLAFSHRIQNSVLYVCVSFSVLHIGLSLTSF